MDFTYEFTGNTLNFSPLSEDHTNVAFTLTQPDGEEVPSMNGKQVRYTWRVIFDGQSEASIAMPQLPQELKALEFGSLYEQNDLNLEQIEIRKYEGINNYAEYLQNIIGNNEFWYLVAPKREMVFKRTHPQLQYYRSDWYNFLID